MCWREVGCGQALFLGCDPDYFFVFLGGGNQACFPRVVAVEFSLMALLFLKSRHAGNCWLGNRECQWNLGQHGVNTKLAKVMVFREGLSWKVTSRTTPGLHIKGEDNLCPGLSVSEHVSAVMWVRHWRHEPGRSAEGFFGGGEHEGLDFVRQAGHQTSPATAPPVTGIFSYGASSYGEVMETPVTGTLVTGVGCVNESVVMLKMCWSMRR